MAGMLSAYRRRFYSRPFGSAEGNNTHRDGHTEHHRDVAGSPIEPAAGVRHAEPVGVGGAEGAGEHVAGPERGDRVEAREAIRQSRQHDETGEHETRREKAQM